MMVLVLMMLTMMLAMIVAVDGYDDDFENDTYKLTEYLYIFPGPTLKLRRPIVSKMFKDKIDGLYEDEH